MSFHYVMTPKRIAVFIEKTKDGHPVPVQVRTKLHQNSLTVFRWTKSWISRAGKTTRRASTAASACFPGASAATADWAMQNQRMKWYRD